MKDVNIEERFKQLNIISFDSAGMAVKDDVITALNAVEAYGNDNTDEDMYKHIKELQQEKRDRRFKFGGNE
ncbi:hypothetical protein [Treponema sp. Marseille-Q4130]|uniref:hypothetical protein n=1 Tax=Treponema sp. Marseille-Q4130 TaxID=2766702 RepID=UPI00165272A4|nr:hypothetical protein [Treponema sp. Marseille-Q4130]MBC6720302.1 hypothetical protein [Treponema sp. Marseille-Q4130]